MFTKLTRRGYAALIKFQLDMYAQDDKEYNTDDLLSFVGTLVVDQQKQIEALEEKLEELKITVEK